MRTLLTLCIIFTAFAGNILWPASTAASPAPTGSQSSQTTGSLNNFADLRGSAGYTPEQIRHAYGFDKIQATGENQVVAVVVPLGNPHVLQDVMEFDTTFHLPPANINLVFPQGQPTTFDQEAAFETDVDVEWLHAIAPSATIVLEVVQGNQFDDAIQAVQDAYEHQHASVVSMSWGDDEFPSENSYDHIFNVPGVSFVAASGDITNGESVEYPAASPYVLSVGGTSLHLDQSGKTLNELPWSGSISGTSAYEQEPAYQQQMHIISNSRRSVPDVSYDADTATGMFVYDSEQYEGSHGWFAGGGTSIGTPQWAGLLALANSMRSTPLSDVPQKMYSLLYIDRNARIQPDFQAAGYQPQIGLGSPHADILVQDLVRLS